jgi:hypothetical protein
MIAFAMIFLWHEGFKTADVLKTPNEMEEHQPT